MSKEKNQEQRAGTMVALDNKDIEILRLLEGNAKLTVREISSLVHLSPTPVHDRIKRLEKSGVIKQYAALIDSRLVNKSFVAICHVSIKEHNKKAGQIFIDVIQTLDEVVSCYNISGDFDFMLKIVCSSMQAYHQFHMNHLSNIEGIGQTKTFFVMDVIKETHKIV